VNDELRAALADGQAGKALALIEALPIAERQQFGIGAHEADLLGKLGRHEDELAVLDRLIAADPTNASLHLSAANALKTLGRRDEAIAAARQALAIQPGYGKAWWLLAELKTFAFTGADRAAMEAQLAAAAFPADRLHLHFALGRACEQQGETARAFTHYADGKALAASANLPRSMAPLVDDTIATFTPDFFASRRGFGHASAAPIFVLGLHRSGSTLVEQILGAHPQIEATSELPVLGQVMRLAAADPSLAGISPGQKLAALSPARAEALGAEYLARAAEYRLSDEPHFVDKMPSNWLHIGLINLILPNATIIDARRHPMAAGFSNFRQHYGAGASWTNSQQSIGAYYRDYLRLMRHFDRVLPGKVHRIINERLIEDFEPEVRRLLAHVGVDFEPAVLDFHRSGRPVRSASAEQVRRPLSREGVDQWRAFEPWLGPLKDALGPDLEDWQE
jgi:tetratricopeptide (TPR) repeat protein